MLQKVTKYRQGTRVSEGPAEGRRNMEWVVEEGSCEYQLQQCYQI